MRSKYELLQNFLSSQSAGTSEITLTFSQIEDILKSRLPESAYRHQAWWANQSDVSTRTQTKAWINAGFKVDGLYQEREKGWVRFVRGVADATQAECSREALNKNETDKRLSRSQETDLQRFQPDDNALFLLSCVSMKADKAARAKDLYVSPWFHKARHYVESRNASWFILSAEYGLVHPERIIKPYEMTLNAMGAAERRVWARNVISQMRTELPDAAQVVLFAGQRYREFLMDYLRERYPQVVAPLSHMGIGVQLRWFDQDVHDDA